MKLPVIRRSRHDAEVTRLRARLTEARTKVRHNKASAQKHKSAAKRLRAERDSLIERIRELERICTLRAYEIERLGGKVAALSSDNTHTNEAVEQIRGHRDLRSLLAMKLTGEGIEIGALHNPLPVPPGVLVRYVDVRTREENSIQFPKVPAQDIVETAFLCDGQTLSTIPDESQDFVIGNHMLEHVVNPLRALQNFLRVLKPLGRLFISLPDKRFIFDYKRPATPWEHVLQDFQTGREVEERAVYEEFRRCVEPGLDPDEAVATRREIHHHAWTQGEILEFFINAKRVLGWPLEIELFAKQGCEVVLVLQKADPPHEDHAKFAKASST